MKLSYRPEIDGLRTVAVLGVILYHAQIVVFGHDFFKGGFVGVDIFFVISGYLISRILLSELFEKGKINFLQFYERRARRILPVLFVVFIFSFPLAYKYLIPNQFIEYAHSILSATFFGSNIFFYFTNTQYGAEDSLFQPFLHTWSLAVEEQFYILFPVVLLLAYKFAKNHLVSIIAILILVSVQYADWESLRNKPLNFFMITSRFWELGIGGLLAFYEIKYGRIKHEFLNQTMPLIGLAMIIHTIVFFDNQTPHPSFNTLLPTLGTALIILFSVKKIDLVGKGLSWGPIVGIGLISYSMYLWHYPIFAFARISSANEISSNTKFLLLLLIIFLSIISYFFIEKPFRNKQLLNIKKFSSAIVILFFAILSLNLKVIETKGFDKRVIDAFFKKQIVFHSLGNPYEDMFDNNDCNYWQMEFNSYFYERFKTCKERYKKGILILGDSHAMNLYEIFARSNNFKFVASVSRGGCRLHSCGKDPLKNNYITFMNELVETLDENITVIYHQSGSYFLLDRDNKNESQEIFDKKYYKVDYANLKKVNNELNKISKKLESNLIWIGPFIEYRHNPKQILRLENSEFLKKLTINPTSLNYFKKLEYDIKTFFEQNEVSYKYINFEEIYKLNHDAIVKNGDDYCFQFNDDNHFSKCGLEVAAKNFNNNKFKELQN